MRVLVADDHPLVRNALARTVLRADPQAEVFEAHDFPTTRARFETRPPDLALLDLNMPGMRGCQGLKDLRRAFPTIALIVASGQEDAPTVRAVLATGINGFFPKTASADLLMEAIHPVRAGGVYVPPQALADFRDGVPPKVLVLVPPAVREAHSSRDRNLLGAAPCPRHRRCFRIEASFGNIFPISCGVVLQLASRSRRHWPANWTSARDVRHSPPDLLEILGAPA